MTHKAKERADAIASRVKGHNVHVIDKAEADKAWVYWDLDPDRRRACVVNVWGGSQPIAMVHIAVPPDKVVDVLRAAGMLKGPVLTWQPDPTVGGEFSQEMATHGDYSAYVWEEDDGSALWRLWRGSDEITPEYMDNCMSVSAAKDACAQAMMRDGV